MQMDLGDWNQLETDCRGGQCRFLNFLAILFRSAAHGECIWHDKHPGQSQRWVSAVGFLCTFCKSPDGASVTTGEHQVRI
jgi:hypothetical protein